MRGTHLVPVVAILLGVQVGVAEAVPPAAGSTTISTTRAGDPPGPGAPVPAEDRGDLTDDVVRPIPGAGRVGRIRRWPGRVIPYHETIPGAWDWSLDRALDHWNDSGSRIRFVEVAKKRAKLVIRYGPTYGADGIGTLGYQSSNYIHLATTYRRADEHDPETRVWVGRLFAHELGHVLGFEHTAPRCSLMVAIYDFGLCPPLPDDDPGYYHCRWIDAPLLTRFIRMYGGRARRPDALCLIEALPAELRGVAFAGGDAEDSPVRITWRPPPTVPDGTVVRVVVWQGPSCGTVPSTWDRREAVDPRAGRWTDPGFGQGRWCYLVRPENRYGATRPASHAALERYAPVPAAPVVDAPTWRRASAGWRFTWRAPSPGMQLVAVRDEARPEECVGSFDEGRATGLSDLAGDVWEFEAVAPRECVALHVVTEWATTSPGTPVHLVIDDTPPAPVVGARTWDPEQALFRFSWTRPDDVTSLVAVRDPDDPTRCPTTYDADRAEWLDRERAGPTHLLYAYARTECISLFAVTTWGTVSPRTEIVTRVPAPTVSPSVGPVGPWAGDPSWAASASVSLPESPSYALGIEVVAGACPAAPPGDAAWVDGYEDWERPGRWYWYPDTWGDTGPQCVMLAAVDYFGQPGPVVARAFTVPG